MSTTTMNTTRTSPLASVYGVDAQTGSADGCEVAEHFGDSTKEYHALRNSVALSDNSHYGKFRVSGTDALDTMNQVVMADVARLAIGRSTWTFMLREDGSVICDVYVLCAGDEYILLSEGASPADVHKSLQNAADSHSATVADLTQDNAIISIDGPYAWELMKEIVGVRILGLRYLEFLENQSLGSVEGTVIRSGKTGEFGYQVMLPAGEAAGVWELLMTSGKKLDIHPAGTEVLNLCRLENRFINMHCEGTAAKNPLEINCRVMVDQEKEDYIGCEALATALESALGHRTIGLVIEGDAGQTPELGAEISVEGTCLGKIVNTGFSTTLGSPIALGLLVAEAAFVGLDFDIQTESGSVKAKSVSAPFIFNKSMTVRPQEDSYANR